MVIKNASTLPQVYYGLHMAEGIAQYNEGEQPLTILINENTIKKMDPTFVGRPVYVEHVDKVDLKDIKEADGFVVESFFNQADGKHWAKFIIITDAGHEAIRSGWKLSNAYIPKNYSGPGMWHGAQYNKEVISAEYEHLAIVPNPRYEESIILTPEQFKEYNNAKQVELTRLANSKGANTMKFKFFNRTEVEKTADLEKMSVLLPTSKIEKTLSEAIELADKFQNMSGYAAPEHMVKCNDDEEMSVNDLVKKYNDMMMEKKELEAKKNAEDEEAKKKNAEMSDEDKKKANDADEEAKKKALELAAHEEAELKAKKENEAKEEEEKKANALKNEALKNAHLTVPPAPTVDLSMDQVARGISRYGSK